MKSKKKLRKDVYVRQLLVLAGGIMLCTLLILIIPTGTDSSVYKPNNDIDQRTQVSRAADQYLVATNAEERQAAASVVRAARTGSRSHKPMAITDFHAFLRVVAYIAIVLLLWRALAITWKKYKPLKPRRA